MDEFILLFRMDIISRDAQPSPEQLQEYMKQYHDWVGGIAAQNKFVSGTGLPFDGARVVTNKNNKKIVTNGPFGEIKETIGGFIIVRAETVEEAVEFAKGCPVLTGEGNSMEVRKVSSKNWVHPDP